MTIPAEFLNALAAGYAGCGCPMPANRLLLAVSGGADSMALLHGTWQLWSKTDVLIVVAHVDHGLRGEQGRADADFVHANAKQLGLRYRILTCDVAEQVRATGGSTEEVARQLRYRLLQDAARELELNTVVCAHHEDDQAETILHNILRGTGLRGLGGMLRQRDLGDGIQLIRPMLNVTRAATEAYLRHHDLCWRCDESNASSDYTRNRIRRDLMPLLAEEYNPQVAASLVRLGQHAREADAITTQIGERCLEDVVLELQPDVCRLRRERLALWPASVVRAALRLIWDRQAWPQQGMTQTHWQNLAVELQDPNGSPNNVPDIEISTTPVIVRFFRRS